MFGLYFGFYNSYMMMWMDVSWVLFIISTVGLFCRSWEGWKNPMARWGELCDSKKTLDGNQPYITPANMHQNQWNTIYPICSMYGIFTYIHVPQKWPKCRKIFHTWSIWVSKYNTSLFRGIEQGYLIRIDSDYVADRSRNWSAGLVVRDWARNMLGTNYPGIDSESQIKTT